MNVFHGQREYVYPLKISGTFTRIHKGTSAMLFAFLIIVPWLRWGGEPLILADLATRRLTVLGQIFTPSDSVLIMLGLLTGAFLLFFFTSIFGRLWCGYFCPQSVFLLNLVIPVEEWLEGPRSRRMQRAKSPWAFDNAWRRFAKWGIFAFLAVFMSMSFMGFFARTEELWTLQGTAGQYGVVAFFAGLWFFDFAWYREQTCNYICPYARFQGALTDDHSLVISYDVPRGEPRGRAAKDRGGCIDCNKCVVVCPQGIDIRDGYQLECIACGRCVDACTTVMDRLGHDTLVRYSTAARDTAPAGTPIQPTLLRGRTVAYGTLLTVLLGAIGYNLWNHVPLEVNVGRAPGNLWIEDADGFVRNTYMVQLTDKSSADGARTYAVGVEGLPDGAQVQSRPVTLTTSERKAVPVIVRIPRELSRRTLPLTVKVRGEDIEVAHATTFKGPGGPSTQE